MNRDIILRVVSGSVTTDLDINSNIPLRLDVSSLENSKIGRVFGIGSQQFDLPGTRTNNQFFKNAADPGSIDTPAIYEFLTAYLLLDGDVLIEGKFFLKEVIASDDGWITYKCQIVDQTIDFKTQLDGKFISEADWSAYDHELSGNAIKDGFTDDLVSGSIFYPLADYGTDESIPFPTLPRIQVNGTEENIGCIDATGSRMALQQFQPAVSAIDTFDVMFEQAGYNYISTIVTASSGVPSQTGPFQNLFVMPKSNEDLGPVVSGSTDNSVLVVYSNTQIGSPPFIPANTFVIVSSSFTDVLSDPGSNYTVLGGASGTGKYVVPVGGTFTISGQIELTNPAPSGGGAPDQVVVSTGINVYGSGSNTLTNIVQFGSRVFDNNTAATASVGGSRTFEANQGDRFEPYLSFYNYSFLNGSVYYVISGSNTFFNMTESPSQYTGTTVKMDEQWNADTKTSDVLKGFIEQFNLVLTPEYGTEKTIRVETFDTWMQQGTVVDWTQKYDKAKRISIKHPISEQNKELQISNAEDNDRFSKLAKENEPNLQYGTIQIVSDSEIPLGTRKISSYFAPTIVGSLIQSGSVTDEGNPTFNLSGNTMFIPHLYKLNGTKQETFAFKPRLGYRINQLEASPAFNDNIYFGDPGGELFSSSFYSTLANISSINVSAANTIYNLHFDKSYPDYVAIGGQYNLAEDQSKTNYELYWNNYIQGLYWDEARKLTLSLQFTPEEYKDIKLNNIIVIKNQRYRINKIRGFNITYPDICTVELLKEFPVYNAVTQVNTGGEGVMRYLIRSCDTGIEHGTKIPTGSLAYNSPATGSVLAINTRVSGSANGSPQGVYKITGYATTIPDVEADAFTLTGFNGCPTGSGAPSQTVIISVTDVGDAVRLYGTNAVSGLFIDETIIGNGTQQGSSFPMFRELWNVELIGGSATYTG